MSTDRIIRYEFRASYLDQETILQSLQNCINHYQELQNVVDYRGGNMFLGGTQTYSATNQNFLFFASDLDVLLTINGSMQFTLREIVLIQKEIPFSFQVALVNGQTSPCTVNIHYLHGKLM